MKTTLAALVFTTILVSPALAVLHPGDLLVAQYQGNAIQQYSPTGTLLQTFSDNNLTQSWQGPAITPTGLLVSTFRFPNQGVNIFNPNGTLVRSFLTPQFTTSGDVSVFADGNIAITNDQSNSLFIYSQTGTLLNSFIIPGASIPTGSFAQGNTLWVASFASPSKLIHITESGVLLNSVNTAFPHPDDLALDPAGIVWTNSANDGTIASYSPAGALLSSFPTGLQDGNLAIANDGSIYLDKQFGDSRIYHYSQTGVLLDSFFMTNPNNPFTITVVPTPEPTTLTLLALASIPLLRRRK